MNSRVVASREAAVSILAAGAPSEKPPTSEVAPPLVNEQSSSVGPGNCAPKAPKTSAASPKASPRPPPEPCFGSKLSRLLADNEHGVLPCCSPPPPLKPRLGPRPNSAAAVATGANTRGAGVGTGADTCGDGATAGTDRRGADFAGESIAAASGSWDSPPPLQPPPLAVGMALPAKKCSVRWRRPTMRSAEADSKPSLASLARRSSSPIADFTMSWSSSWACGDVAGCGSARGKRGMDSLSAAVRPPAPAAAPASPSVRRRTSSAKWPRSRRSSRSERSTSESLLSMGCATAVQERGPGATSGVATPGDAATVVLGAYDPMTWRLAAITSDGGTARRATTGVARPPPTRAPATETAPTGVGCRGVHTVAGRCGVAQGPLGPGPPSTMLAAPASAAEQKVGTRGVRSRTAPATGRGLVEARLSEPLVGGRQSGPGHAIRDGGATDRIATTPAIAGSSVRPDVLAAPPFHLL
mmetsp:Transcript_97001/g.216339  ORF Transcript_97001/g.216339 Transcript_97001/m.216339 type:complete len:470 (-) Transcript_97001:15-1424(-)